jgi:hypothetical protein
LKALFDNVDDDGNADTDVVDNPAVFESEGDDDKAFLVEMQKLAKQAAEFAAL